MPLLDPPPPHHPNYYPAPDLLRIFVSGFESATAAAVALGVGRSELSHWMNWRQRPGDEKRARIEERSDGKISKDSWVSRAEREAAEAKERPADTTPPAAS